MFKIIESEKPWYAEGLSFKCTGCGACCTGSPGYVWVNEEEIEAIAAHLNLSVDEFSKKYLRQINGRFSLIEHPKTYDCVFLKEKKCQIYPVRPTQCGTFPWWPPYLKSKESWNNLAAACEGICPNAPVVSIDEIESQAALQKEKGFLLEEN
ncbi:MAG: YkgJ family cysteine cluster protein [Parachlamydia sp.]|jgi:hypothetical protein|nr:YkgJ family cysteine cluster protein [Parachlamydia sp.]